MPKNSLSVTEKFNTALCRYNMLDGKSSVLVGFSGGTDSSLLLALLSQIDGLTVYAAHLNHMIRGEEADRDELFCRDFCGKLGIKLFVKHSDIPCLSKKLGIGLEEAARQERYSFFDETVKENSIDVIATAHNASDNAETLLFNLIRGCGPNGLCGIPPVRGNIIRPLILCTKDEINDECQNKNIPYVIDSTNSDTDYTRNYIRHKLIPPIKKLNPSFEAAASETSALMLDDRHYFEELTKRYSLSDGRRVLSALPKQILNRVLLSELGKNGISPTSEHIALCRAMIGSDAVRSSVSLVGGSFVCDRDTVYIENKDTAFEKISTPIPLSYGLNEISPRLAVIIKENGDDFSKEINKLKNIYKLSIQASFDSDKINGTVFVRNRNEGDKYRFGGITRSVKKLLQSKKLTLKERDMLPVFTLGDEIIWIPSFPVSDGVRASCSDNITEIICFTDAKDNTKGT